jgi:hypothetical protein
MPAHIHGENSDKQRRGQISSSHRYSRLSIFITMVLDNDEDGGGIEIENGIDGRRTHEIPLRSIKSPVLARIVRYLERYTQEPCEFVM